MLTTFSPVPTPLSSFGPKYNDLFHDVVKPVCTSLDLDAQRADDTYGPEVIIKDIERQILEARIIVADVTPKNLNVYYEVGFAHALKKGIGSSESWHIDLADKEGQSEQRE